MLSKKNEKAFTDSKISKIRFHFNDFNPPKEYSEESLDIMRKSNDFKLSKIRILADKSFDKRKENLKRVMDKAFETGMRFDFNIVHNFEKIKQKLKEKELKNANKNALSLPKIKQNSMSRTSIDKNFNLVDIGELKNELSTANIKDNVSVVNDNNNNFRRTNYSQDFHKELSTDQNVIHNYNESKNASVIGEHEESVNITSSKKDLMKRHTLFNNVKEPEDLKALLDKEISGKGNHAYHRMKTDMFKSLSNRKSSNQLLNQITHGSEAEENNKSQYDRFFKVKQRLQTPTENYDEENKIPEIEHKEEEEAETNMFDFALKKPKRKIQIAIFTQKNIKDEEIHDLEPFMKRLEINGENDENKNKDNESAEKKPKGSDKDKKIKNSPVKHPLVFPEFNKYGLYSGYKKQELKVKYGMTVLKKNGNFHKNRSLILNNSGSQEDIKNSSTSNSPQKHNEKNKSEKSDKLPKIKGVLQSVYKEDPEIIKAIRNLRHMNNLSLEEYQLKLIDVAKKILDDENLKNLVNRFKDISDISQTKDKVKYHRSINRWEIMVKVISRYIPEFLVEKLKSQK